MAGWGGGKYPLTRMSYPKKSPREHEGKQALVQKKKRLQFHGRKKRALIGKNVPCRERPSRENARVRKRHSCWGFLKTPYLKKESDYYLEGSFFLKNEGNHAFVLGKVSSRYGGHLYEKNSRLPVGDRSLEEECALRKFSEGKGGVSLEGGPRRFREGVLLFRKGLPSHSFMELTLMAR